MISFSIDGMSVVVVTIFALIATVHVLNLSLELIQIAWFTKSTRSSIITQSIPILCVIITNVED